MILSRDESRHFFLQASHSATVTGFILVGLGIPSLLLGLRTTSGGVFFQFMFLLAGLGSIAAGITALVAAPSVRRQRLWAAIALLTIHGLIVLGLAAIFGGLAIEAFSHRKFLYVGVYVGIGLVTLIEPVEKVRRFIFATNLIRTEQYRRDTSGFEPVVFHSLPSAGSARPTPAPLPARSTPSAATDDNGSPGRTPTSRGA